MKLIAGLRWIVVLSVASCAPVTAGPYDDPGIPADTMLPAWGSRIVDYHPAHGVESNSHPINALAAPDGRTVSLGDLGQAQLDVGMPSGSITLQFDNPLRDGPGWDLAVFENAFQLNDDYVFAELGFVEVSSDGIAYVRFPAVSLSQDRFEFPTAAFSGVDPSDIYNLAGKHTAGMGTPFDLIELAVDPLILAGDVHLHDIRYVRIVDIPGSASWQEPLLNPDGSIAFADNLGSPILDPWNTAITGVAGFDLDAIGGRYIRDVTYGEVLLANMFQVGTDGSTGDLNADGVTDAADFNLWNAVDFVDPRQSLTMVPEPTGLHWCSTIALFCFVVLRPWFVVRR